ncbi:MAG: hypothetical protein AMS18_03945 [Gemmatimonas sp. SG8_17]|nr:MAG: hypothetical protein AMS18_03945 [Gemmatimonas sp. SG8_17]
MVHAALAVLPLLSLTVPVQVIQEAPRVSVFLYLADLVEIAGSEQAFVADVFVAARWNDPTLAGEYEGVRTLDLEEVWHPILVVVNERGAYRSLPEVVNVDPVGNVQYTVRLTGRFSATMDLKDFPLDRQVFDIWVVAPLLGGNRVELLPDTTASVLRNGQLSISDWTIGDPELVVKEYQATPQAGPLQGVALVVEAKRKTGYYIIQVLIPLVAIVLMAWTVFWIDPSVVATRVGVVVSTMLTLIAYRFMLGNLVPRLSYLTRLDYFMLGTTSIVVLTLFVMAAASYLRGRGQDAIVSRIDSIGRLAFPLTFGAFSLLVWLM